MDSPKEYINDMTYNGKNALPLNDDLDNIIESEYKKAFESLDKYDIIKHIERKYGITYIKPRLKIEEDNTGFVGMYLPFENEIRISKKAVEGMIDSQLEFLGYKEIKRKDIEYLNRSYKSILLYPFYINKRNIIEALAKAIILSIILHEDWHSIDNSILNKLEKDPAIKDRDYLLTILNNDDNTELRASAFEVIMYYLVNGFYKHEKGYIAAYHNIPICRNYIEKVNALEKNEYINRYVPYDLGFCYGNTVVAANKSSLKENMYNIIDNIIDLDEKKAIDEIKHYVYNPDELLHD